MVPVTNRSARLLGRMMALANILSAGAALMVASVALIATQFVALRGALVDDLRVQARIIGNNSSAALMFKDQRAGEETLAALATSPSVTSATIFAADGQALARYARVNAAALAPLTAPPPALVKTGHAFSWDDLLVTAPVRVNGQHVGVVLIRANLDQLWKRLLTYAGLTIAIALASLLLAYALLASMRRAVRGAEERLHFLAHVDAVTMLPNRNAFNERLAFALEQADRCETAVGLLLIDLDNFKVVNDTLGHDSGDALLTMVAARLTATLRIDDVICRIGGDEFVIIVAPGDDIDEPDGVARKVLAALASPFELTLAQKHEPEQQEQQDHQQQVHQLHVTASIGVSVYPRDARDALTLIRRADTAMYHAKNHGKNSFEVFQPAMEQRAQRRLKIEANLRRALTNNELQVHYQPQIDLRSGAIVGVEALARWHCVELGQVSPADFIPVAEESGIIVELGRWVLHSVCQQAAEWHRAGLLDTVAHVAVNLSARQMRDGALMDDIHAILAATRLPAGLLELEITEGVLVENVNANVELMHAVQGAGIHLSIDDFGTGYSSMSYLKRFPIDQLKIDRSFIGDVPGDGEAIATAIIAMAHSLGLTVVAEGVETAEQVEFLLRAGCDIAQGYYFARPMAPALLTDLLQHRLPAAQMA